LKDAGISRERVYVTNLVKCYGGPGDPCPTNVIYDQCEELLDCELSRVQPRLILPLGSDSYRRLTGHVDSIVGIQGKVYCPRHQAGVCYFPLTHPSYWIRTPGYYEEVIRSRMVPIFRSCLEKLELGTRLK
jgi:uracil-DNA glycosylase family 4